MGGSSWYYVVPYQPDIEAALQQLRQDVYDRGEYYRETVNPAYATMSEDEFRATLNPNQWDSGINDALLEEFRAARRRPTPIDPDTLFDAQPHSGTHSIIDIRDGVWPVPKSFTVSPLTDEELLSYLGTVTPTSAQIRALPWTRDRWVGTYVVGHLNGLPHEIHFFGYSGD